MTSALPPARMRRAVGQRPPLRSAHVAVRTVTSRWRRAPELLLVGTQRGGTTSLFSYLAAHPDVRPPVVKEVHGFTLHWSRGEPWYRAHFPVRSPTSLSIDASPYYLFHPLAAERAASTVPDARIVVLLRDPVERAWSHYQHSVRLGFEEHSFRAALDLEEKRLAGEVDRIRSDPRFVGWRHRQQSYRARGEYGEQLRAWLAVYPRERLVVVRSEDLYANPAATFARVLEAVGLRAWQPREFAVHGRTGSPDRRPDPDVVDTLTAHYAGEPERISALLDRRISWPRFG